jgi:hypothetical protein
VQRGPPDAGHDGPLEDVREGRRRSSTLVTSPAPGLEGFTLVRFVALPASSPGEAALSPRSQVRAEEAQRRPDRTIRPRRDQIEQALNFGGTGVRKRDANVNGEPFAHPSASAASEGLCDLDRCYPVPGSRSFEQATRPGVVTLEGTSCGCQKDWPFARASQRDPIVWRLQPRCAVAEEWAPAKIRCQPRSSRARRHR